MEFTSGLVSLFKVDGSVGFWGYTIVTFLGMPTGYDWRGVMPVIFCICAYFLSWTVFALFKDVIGTGYVLIGLTFILYLFCANVISIVS